MKLISIIVPVHNVQPYIERCVRSLMAQTYTNIEIILVDDCAMDDSPEICEDLAAEDSRIRLLYQPSHNGLHDSRNAGMAASTGDMIAFVDPDDWVSPYYIETMLRCMRDNYADIAECNFIESNGSLRLPEPPRNPEVMIYTAEEALQLMFMGKSLHCIVWNKLYKRSVIEGLLFETGKCNTGENWTAQAFGHARTVAKVNAPLYYRYLYNGKNMEAGYQPNLVDIIDAMTARQLYIDQYYPSLSDHAATDMISALLTYGKMVLGSSDKNKRAKMMDTLQNRYRHLMEGRRIRYMVPGNEKKWYKLAELNFTAACKMKH